MSSRMEPIRRLAQRLYEIWLSELREKSPGMDPIHYAVLPLSVQEAWEKVARECIMESEAIANLKKLL